MIIDNVGGSTAGYSRTQAATRPMTPAIVISSETTIVRTGRRMLISAKRHRCATVRRRPSSTVTADPWRSCCKPEVTTISPALEPRQDLHAALDARARVDLAALGLAVTHDEHVLRVRSPGSALRPARATRRSVSPSVSSTLANAPGSSTSPGFGHSARISSVRVAVSMRGSKAYTVPANRCGRPGHREGDRAAEPNSVGVFFRHREIDLQRVEALQRRDARRGIHERAFADVAQPDDAVERRANLGLRDLRLRERDLRAPYVHFVERLVVIGGDHEPLGEQLRNSSLAELGERHLVCRRDSPRLPSPHR